MTNPYLYNSDKHVLDQINRIQLGTVVSVDTDKAMVEIQWGDKQGARIFVPIPMPFVGGGWGVLTMPTGGESVVVGLREDQSPVVLAYMPYNTTLTTSLESFYTRMLNDFGLKPIDEGEIFIRNRMNYANCNNCHNINTLDAWGQKQVHLNPTDLKSRLIDTCPHCHKPAVDYSTNPSTNYKMYLGCRAYFKNDGSITINQEADLNDGTKTVGAQFIVAKDGSMSLIDKNGNSFVINVDGFTITTESGTTITANELGNVSINAMTVNIGNKAAGGIITDLTHPVDFFTGTPMITRSSKTIKASS